MDHKQETNNTSNMFAIFQDNGTKCTLKSAISPSNEESMINQCECLKRLVFGLSFYEKQRNKTSKHSLISFMNEIYPINQFIDDIKHYKVEHGNDNHLLSQLQQELISNTDLKFDKCTLEKCNYTNRHFTRNDNNNNEQRTVSITDKDENESNDDLYNMYALEFDNFHFNLMHIFNSYFRIKTDENGIIDRK